MKLIKVKVEKSKRVDSESFLVDGYEWSESVFMHGSSWETNSKVDRGSYYSCNWRTPKVRLHMGKIGWIEGYTFPEFKAEIDNLKQENPAFSKKLDALLKEFPLVQKSARGLMKKRWAKDVSSRPYTRTKVFSNVWVEVHRDNRGFFYKIVVPGITEFIGKDRFGDDQMRALNAGVAHAKRTKDKLLKD